MLLTEIIIEGSDFHQVRDDTFGLGFGLCLGGKKGMFLHVTIHYGDGAGPGRGEGDGAGGGTWYSYADKPLVHHYYDHVNATN